MIKDYVSRIQDADLVLVGIGPELSAHKLMDFKKEITNGHYQKLLEMDAADENVSWMKQVYERFHLLNLSKVPYFKALEEVLEQKNYFVITSNDDGLIFHSDLDKGRLVAPCGSGDFFQCKVPCSEQLYPAGPGLGDLIRHYETTGEIEHLECPKCGEPLVFNIRTEDTKSTYIEGAYLNGWAAYTKWLQNTLNKKLFILELGEGFKVPGLFRWPFEKMAYYNEKAYMVRVSRTLYQTGEELKGKAEAVKMDSREFLGIER
ncbi:hypothetical protein [Anaerostipes sp.]|uniref:hypothetical protein n=1 Tax=Anaerostipes sp. TaxID=1872530 RepID=UPI0025BC7DAE|nr:hypothetical protein [Anaerostipes sp.]MBS7008247.1 hypothetical protein [Anaerostipes sp.]